jgi:hypothetical protein
MAILEMAIGETKAGNNAELAFEQAVRWTLRLQPSRLRKKSLPGKSRALSG